MFFHAPSLIDVRLFALAFRRFVTVVEHDETEEESTSHHRKRRDIIRVRRGDESLVFRVA